ncbi:hypothetical protein KAS08_01280 [Candidatus Pacearchaeota archaeon]|nr:hypothetical protein [Candidatus Pacearchaeota archaeon]
MKIKFLGSIEKNKGLIDDLLEALKELNIDPHLKILNSPRDFIKYKVRAPAAIIINENVIFKGHHDLSKNIKKALKEEIKKEKTQS